MKKTITVNLGGTVFSIDEDAYDLLRVYLEKIEGHFKGSTDRQEIMNDIEARIAELLSPGNHSLSHAVTLKDVEEIIVIMGEPAEFASEAGETDPGTRSGVTVARTRKRIYRDVDNRILGGVCSGLGAYLSVDVIWIRIIFVVLALMAFSGVLVYVLLWIVVPPALTTAQKLEMKGEPVNFQNIGRAVKEEFENVRKNLKI
jgi:phage shock protein PspC (stress-responsive transcriptional regulator)